MRRRVLFWYPLLAAHRSSERPVEFVDVYPTLAELSRLRAPRGLDEQHNMAADPAQAKTVNDMKRALQQARRAPRSASQDP